MTGGWRYERFGRLLLLGFVVFAGLMAARLLPTLLALPLMAAFIAWVAGMSFTSYLESVLMAGSIALPILTGAGIAPSR